MEASAAIKTWDLIKRLADRTKAGKIRWEATSFKDAYQTAFPNSVVRVVAVAADYAIEIYDEENRMIERVSDVDLAPVAGEGPRPYQIMRDMFEQARRDALGVNETIDSIISFLDQDES